MMKIVRYLDASGKEKYGRAEEDGTIMRIDGDVFGDYRDSRVKAEVKKLLAPMVPTNILCIGLNYRKHADEGKKPVPNSPVLFIKNLATLQNPGDPIVLPRHLRSDMVDYECELAVVIGKPCKNVSKTDALDYVLGYTCANDVSARDWQKEGGGSQW